MGDLDVLSWIAGGLVAGALTGALRPGGTPGEHLAMVTAGFVGACAGGAAVTSFTDMNAVAFLGAVCAAVAGAQAPCATMIEGNRGRGSNAHPAGRG